MLCRINFVLCSFKLKYTSQKDGFTEVSKNLTRYRSENIILLNYQNNYVFKLVARMLKYFATLSKHCLNVLRNYFDRRTKLYRSVSS